MSCFFKWLIRISAIFIIVGITYIFMVSSYAFEPGQSVTPMFLFGFILGVILQFGLLFSTTKSGRIHKLFTTILMFPCFFVFLIIFYFKLLRLFKTNEAFLSDIFITIYILIYILAFIRLFFEREP